MATWSTPAITKEEESLDKTDFCMQMFLIFTIFSGCGVKWINNEFTVKKLERARGCDSDQLWITGSLEEISLRDAG